MAKPIKVSEQIKEKIDEIIKLQEKGAEIGLKLHKVKEELKKIQPYSLAWELEFDGNKVRYKNVYRYYDLSEEDKEKIERQLYKAWEEYERYLKEKIF